MQEYSAEFSVEKMSQVFYVSRSGYYRFLNTTPSKRQLENERLTKKIEIIHEAPNQRWVADFSYVPTSEGWLVGVILDLFSRRIVRLATHETMTANLVLSALEQAILHRQPKIGLVHHSNRDRQYTNNDFQNLLKKDNITCSMSGAGNCYDNAAVDLNFSLRGVH